MRNSRQFILVSSVCCLFCGNTRFHTLRRSERHFWWHWLSFGKRTPQDFGCS